MVVTPEYESWRPIAPDTDRATISKVVLDIADAVVVAGNDEQQLSAAGGAAGFAVCLSHIHTLFPQRGYLEGAKSFLALAHEGLSEQTMSHGLYGGFTGVAWATWNCMKTHPELEEKVDVDDFFSEVDAALMEVCARRPFEDEYDLVGGLVGVGTFALSRRNSDAARRLFRAVVTALSDAMIVEGGLCTWNTPPSRIFNPAVRQRFPSGYRNLGLAHGVPGVVAMLAKGIEVEWGNDSDYRTLEGCVAFLENCAILSSSRLSRFSYYAGDQADSRLAWCYGDLGVGAALLIAARAVQDNGWHSLASELLALCAKRTVADSGVKDAGLCHGAAGNLHLFNVLYQATGYDWLRDAAVYWLHETLSMRNPNGGIGGYQAFDPLPDRPGEGTWRDSCALLTGAGGIGLALAATLDVTKPAWDEFLLLP